jgi:hypothetical protein
MLSGDQKLDLRNVCEFSGGAYHFEFSWKYQNRISTLSSPTDIQSQTPPELRVTLAHFFHAVDDLSALYFPKRCFSSIWFSRCPGSGLGNLH